MKKLTIKNFVKSVLVASSVVVAPMMVVDSVFGAAPATSLEDKYPGLSSEIEKLRVQGKNLVSDEQIAAGLVEPWGGIYACEVLSFAPAERTIENVLCYAVANGSSISMMYPGLKNVLGIDLKALGYRGIEGQETFKQILKEVYSDFTAEKEREYKEKHEELKKNEKRIKELDKDYMSLKNRDK